MTPKDQSFSVVTWNVLAQSYVRPSRYPTSPPEALEEAHRTRLVRQRVSQLQADVYCLQELEQPVFDALRDDLDDSHVGFFTRRSGHADGTAVFAHKRFGWLRQEVVRFKATRPDDDTRALLVWLSVGRGYHVKIASAHLTWQPDSTPTAEHLGLLQMKELLALRQPPEAWILAGDLNATTQSNVLLAAYEAGMEESCRAQRPWDTTNVNGRCRKIDYLLTEGLNASPSPLPKLTSATPMPSLTEPSDHLPLRVTFEFKGR